MTVEEQSSEQATAQLSSSSTLLVLESTEPQMELLDDVQMGHDETQDVMENEFSSLAVKTEDKKKNRGVAGTKYPYAEMAVFDDLCTRILLDKLHLGFVTHKFKPSNEQDISGVLDVPFYQGGEVPATEDSVVDSNDEVIVKPLNPSKDSTLSKQDCGKDPEEYESAQQPALVAMECVIQGSNGVSDMTFNASKATVETAMDIDGERAENKSTPTVGDEEYQCEEIEKKNPRSKRAPFSKRVIKECQGRFSLLKRSIK
jgi:hypothetical protein